MTAVKTLVGWVALLFHTLFCLTVMVLGALGLASGKVLHLGMAPWTGETLTRVLLFGGLFGLISVAFAVAEKQRFLFFLWTLAAALALSKGMVFSSYHFPPGEWKHGLYLLVAVWLTVPGAWFLMRAKPGPGPRKYRVK